ncbi:UBA/THIF-type NAD/FAD binding fold protein [Marinomonas sp. MED121]|uniref:HesA/MoeB/ThiF family protein n=1 Tax=Marinomonas sp. MED121 TaxID=314277 RepID=UPI000068FBF2|nr:molybdopterin-synthase adenylyltransferase MoeB [Marinomonas sp. MED121]EAQ63773.1 UBA/THIF-type NAD/FAD binding fold protein [Marinomonas sp. MED121]
MNELQLDRYSRQILLPNFDIEGQQRLMQARVMVIGMGGLGNIASCYLAAAGIGHMTLVDDDVVELSNLARQVLYRQDDIQQPKALAAKAQIAQMNDEVEVEVVLQRLDEASLTEKIQGYDLVLDCTDNFKIRQIINKLCHQYKIDLVSGAAIRWEGQVQSFLFSKEDTICYQCLYPELNDTNLNCSQSGIISPVVGSIGVLQSLDAIKILSKCGQVVHAKLRVFDGFDGVWRDINLTQDPECVICG